MSLKQIRWSKVGDEAFLQYRDDALGGWRSYKTSPYYRPDDRDMSRGYRTMQALLAAGYIYEQH